MRAQTIAISQIDASDRLRPVDPLVVEAYAAIAEQRVNEGLSPLIQPIIVRPWPEGANSYKLTAGAHRLAVLGAIGREELVVGDDVIVRAEGDDNARDSEIFENLADAGLTALDRAIFLNEAKQRFDAKRGETRGRKRKDVEFKEKEIRAESAIISSQRFTKDAARRIGLAEVVVKEAVRIAKALDPLVIPQLRGTMIEDNQNELKQLAELDGGSQRKAVAAIRGGEVKTVAQARVAIGVDKPKTDDLQARIYADLLDRWSKASNKTKRQFMADVGLVYAEKDEKA
ncbi:ParB N-terminal domain-containing protein [Methylocystis sp. L43]|uniref:ParB N-terminal domain-containing protein n=1 Tax=unclassified Methylocystis TaxID=2625913 RepID=UPI0018C2797C|nr:MULTISPECIES: ParB N-terminal domain-containing protein [unclassified Methylocystis]MBG0796815.1 ParB N-terminal domain-containing protein [Methylocystis sp. L43]MBG0806102.1 ParB N-terminal domain-containing protein [Methylocystis sp. H15]